LLRRSPRLCARIPTFVYSKIHFLWRVYIRITEMNFYFTAANTLERVDARKGSIKGILGGLDSKERPRVSALVIETLKCESHHDS
jgi:hypothetical protein